MRERFSREELMNLLRELKNIKPISLPEEIVYNKKLLMKSIWRYYKEGDIEATKMLFKEDIKQSLVLAGYLNVSSKDIWNTIEHIFKTKGVEYSGNEDALDNFKGAEKLIGVTPMQSLLNYKYKHLRSLESIVNGIESVEGTLSRLADDIAYSVLGIAMCIATERERKEDYSKKLAREFVKALKRTLKYEVDKKIPKLETLKTPYKRT